MFSGSGAFIGWFGLFIYGDGGAMFLNGWRHVSVADSEAVNCQVISVFDMNLDTRYFTDGHMYYICVGIFLLKYYSISQWFH